MLIIRLKFLLFILILSSKLFGQNIPTVRFDGQAVYSDDACFNDENFHEFDATIKKLVNDITAIRGFANRFIIRTCPNEENFAAQPYKGDPYILYNPDYLRKSISQFSLNKQNNGIKTYTSEGWELLSILSHEIGHHINNHF